ncbi:MAG: hypothetical protein AAFV72_16180 [Cyanobacteria bacterium J06635_1]
MLRFRFRLRHLFALSLLITTAGVRPANAKSVSGDPVGLDFSLPTTVATAGPSVKLATAPTHSAADTSTEILPAPRYEPLRIPSAAIAPPVQTQAIANPKVYGGTTSIGVAVSPNKVAQLPPPPEVQNSQVQQQSPSRGESPTLKSLGLNFDPDENSLPIPAPPKTVIAAQPINLEAPDPQRIFEGGSDSLVARIVGSAEGTRTADGQRTTAYYGHVDPGNGVWNLGTFSYQHGASSPEEADVKQLARLQRQGNTLEHKASLNGLELSLLEKLNGLDLANQSPRAALERGGYIERLAEARQQGMDGADAILWARTHAYMDPDTQRWNAPGLGNTHHSISRDQARRLRAINRALDGYATATVPTQQTLDFDQPDLDIFEPHPSNEADQPTLDIFDEPAPESIASAEPEPPSPTLHTSASDQPLFSAPGLDSGLSFALGDQAKPTKLAEPQTRLWRPTPPTEIPHRTLKPDLPGPQAPESQRPTDHPRADETQADKSLDTLYSKPTANPPSVARDITAPDIATPDTTTLRAPNFVDTDFENTDEETVDLDETGLES